MNNDEIITKRNQAITDANKVYNQIINDQTNLVNNQSQQIDNYLQNSESAINQSVNNNISALNSASETARRQHETEKQAIMKNYQNYANNNADETARIGYLNSARNRIATSEGSLSDVIQEYNNQIAQAKITGQSILAQQALEMLKQKYDLYNANIDNTNNMLIANQKNKQQLISDYGNLDNQYSGVRNDYLDRQQDYNLFNKEMAYKNQQLNTQKKLKEQEYQLDLRDAKESYYRSRSSSSGGSSGGYSFNDTSGETGNNITNGSQYVKTGSTAIVNGKNRTVYSKGGKYYYLSNGKYIQITANQLSNPSNTKSGGGKNASGAGSGGGGARTSSTSNNSAKKNNNIFSKLFQILS